MNDTEIQRLRVQGEPARHEVTVLRRARNPKGVLLIDAEFAPRPLTQAEVEAVNQAGAEAINGCTVRNFVTRTCERGTKGCGLRHDYNPSLSQVFDKLHAAGVEVGVNCDPVPALRRAGAL
jgi:hypothetical protein